MRELRGEAGVARRAGRRHTTHNATNTVDAEHAGIGHLPMASMAARSDAVPEPQPSSAAPAMYMPGVDNAPTTTVT